MNKLSVGALLCLSMTVFLAPLEARSSWELLFHTVEHAIELCEGHNINPLSCKKLKETLENLKKGLNARSKVCDSPISFKKDDHSKQTAHNLMDAIHDDLFNPDHIMGVYECVNTHQEKWKKECKNQSNKKTQFKRECELKTDNNQSDDTAQILFSNDCEKIFLQFPGSLLGAGHIKEYNMIFEFGTWKHLAGGHLIQGNLAQLDDETRKQIIKGIKTEVHLLNKIRELSPENRVGLGEVTSASKAFMIQEYFGSNLEKTSIELGDDMANSGTDYQALSQLVRGLENFHKHTEHVHGDLKPQNIMIKNPLDPHKVTAAIIDYDLSYNTNDFYQSTDKTQPSLPRLGIGTPGHIPPEQWEQEWHGNNAEEVRELSQKGDILPFANIIRLLIKGEEMAWIYDENCQSSPAALQNCMKEMIPQEQKTLRKVKDDLNRLLASMIDLDVEKRPKSTQVRESVDLYIQKHIYTTLRANKVEGIQLKPYQENQDYHLPKLKYIITPEVEPTTGRYYLKIHYSDLDGKMVHKALKANPFSQTEAVEEVKKLQKKLQILPYEVQK
jgi:serine/threonine protein kinase